MRILLIIFLGSAAFASSASMAQDPGAGPEEGPEKGAEKGADEDRPGEEPEEPGAGSAARAKKVRQPNERERQILKLFTASSKGFTEEGKLVLLYNFESKDQELVVDWRPTLEETKKRIRWAQGYEGSYTSFEDGILVADFGQWIHKAVFLADVQVRVDHLSVAQYRPGTILAPIFFNEKKKKSIGVNGGYQAVCLSGWKAAKAPHPKDEKIIPTNLRQVIGYRYDGKVLESYLKDKKTSDTSAAQKYTEGFDTGRVGLAWSGSVQSFIFSVRIEGRLDPDWVAKQLGEKDPARSTGNSTGKKAKR